MGLLGRIFGGKDADHAPQDPRVPQTVARVLEMHARLRLAPRCEARLADALAPALAHISALVAGVPRAHEATTAAWSGDPYMRAYFAAADDIGQVLARSRTLRAFFDENAGADTAFAVMGMAMNERRTLGVAQVGEQTRSDVRQTTLGFSDHHIRLCGADEDELREEVTRRMIDQLAIEGLAKVAADTSMREDLEHDRALLATRLRLLERQGAGLRGMVGAEDEAADPGEMARVRAEVEENEQRLKDLGPRSEVLSRQLDTLCETFANAPTLLQVSTEKRRLDRMNVVVEHGVGDEAGSQVLEFRLARVPGNPPQQRALALLKIARADVPRAVNPLDNAERLL
ncbi:hypothetical protein [Variovorax sp. OV329]|uniref:hypothetical protein n=1 Tax=Variovorax sp. OV329 TaxID=1882825 RepID=UPI0008E428C2|nr:hypothetical protein [Variovorax sp. OV329]SFM82980.1 hypothetical protein SAMN05444747_109130 [Variovorax sp. OV329]